MSRGAAATLLADRFVASYPAEVARMAETWETPLLVDTLGCRVDREGLAVVESLLPEAAARLIGGIETGRAARVLAMMDPGRAAAVLCWLEESHRETLLASLPAPAARDLRELLSYPPDAAGSLMDTRVPTFRPEAPAGAVLARLQAEPDERRTPLIVVDGDSRLVGMLAPADLAFADPETVLGDLARDAPGRIQALASRDDVVDELARSGASDLPVVDINDRVVGLIRHEGIVQAVREEASVDLQTTVGVSALERARSPVSFAVRKRQPWLQVNLLTAFLAATVVGLFEDTIARVTALAILLPVVAGQSGNTGAQALAVTMRGLALREIRRGHWRRIATKETLVGFANGVGVAITASIGVLLWSRSIGLAAVIGASMVVSLTCAGLAGAAVPLTLVAMGQDPAQSSSIILTTVTDVAGFLSFLGIATLLSGML